MDLVVELVDLVAELVMLMLLVLVLLPLVVVELMKQERSHKSSSHPSMKFDAMESTRNEELEARVEAVNDGKAVQTKLTGFPVANMPVVCPFPRCSAVVWKYNLMAHMCGAHIHLFGEKNQRWRKRAAPLVAEFVCSLIWTDGSSL